MGLMVIAFLVLVLSRAIAPSIDGSGVAGAGATPDPVASTSGSPSAPATAAPTASSSSEPTPGVTSTPSVVPTPTLTPTPAPSPEATPAPTPLPTPAPSTTTYRVQAGDTLTSIAGRFGTTVAVLAELNGITDPALIKIGQILKVPA